MRWSRTALRLGAAFLFIFVLFGATLAVTLFTLDEVNRVESQVTAIDHAKHTGHLAAAQVREQYIHQAHILINWSLQHLAHYERVAEMTRTRTRQLQQLLLAPEEQALADQVAHLAEVNAQTFREEVLPAIEQRPDQRGTELSERLEAYVEKVVQLNEELNAKLEQRSLALMQHAQQLRTNARLIVIACFTLAILVSLVLGLLLTRSILHPLSELRKGVLRIAEGDLGTRIHLQGRDEFAELATRFNQMAQDLARHHEDRVRSQRLAAIGQIAAGIAHEINNPLGVILGYVKLMLMAPEQIKVSELQIIEDEARQCQKIVQGLLELARPLRLDQGPVDLADIARETLARLKESGQLRDIKVQVFPDDLSVVMEGDETKLRQVVYNVLLNAVEAMPAGGQLGLEMKRINQEACLTVSDSGAGIDPEVMPRLFEPFFTTKAKGTGLGLVTSQSIVHAHGGRITIDSNPGGGARVSIRLPLA
jgi:signal transduction histidine kinase